MIKNILQQCYIKNFHTIKKVRERKKKPVYEELLKVNEQKMLFRLCNSKNVNKNTNAR